MKNNIRDMSLIIRRVVVTGLCSQLAVSLPLIAQSLPSPVDRWAKASGSYISTVNNSALDNFIKNELPQLKADGVVSGDAYLEKTENGNTLVINQGSVRVLLDWDSFNIGAENSVQFVQPANSALAVNRIDQQSPSVILGKLEANGALWLLNKNGILFGNGAQVNSSALIAAAMDYNGLELDKNLTAADVENFQTGNLFDAIDSGIDNGTGTSAFLIRAQDYIEGSNEIPQVALAAGASIKTQHGGTVLLAAPEVVNEGSIAADGGQIVLAGTKKDLYLALTNPGDKKMRGYIVEVNSGDTAVVAVDVALAGEPEKIEQFTVTRGTGEVMVTGSNGHQVTVSAPEKGGVINAGTLQANLGNITLVAKDIVQAGAMQSSTAVDINGSIRLLARDGAQVTNSSSQVANRLFLNAETLPEKVPVGRDTGQIFFKPGSSTRIDIANNGLSVDGDNVQTANGSLAQQQSQIVIQGDQIVMESGASIVAPSAQVTIEARDNAALVFADDATNFDGSSQFIMEQGAVIDVSGTTDTVVAAERDSIEVFVTSDELKDSPELKGGELLRATLYVDALKGTELFDIDPFLKGIEKTASERNAAGGSVDILATGGVKLAADAVIDVSGELFSTSRV
ncbi:filamentous hemagglutinin N-terminal domain-containing protein [Oceanicoccus sp. KOV_DT_Chl]|uniref:two-partner secretion domain-containing protein n=1 Tax=Oceanicoccus sp. KOV_DT_Chl TaxID=1904639 RepID=UPI000C7A54EE|nr:filamentous hemagglutinin N-terminal domain-containing protein [Oceanicoccus sp. KOV_DT_Chl]